ncbi:YhgE/Pip domain-containing protein [Paenibacillus alvei]|uniref:YhgE/Pip domain-containing protein n=1 Tax=Paenibacillus alvei TaxID=44250 RepID=A0ABT4GRG2_PAEAL|nr:YhgE/Pip domain-containing protein [Paenibacillus alvei]EJW18774.1 phage infection protein Pip [Paenibacillus alvei DSM 29]MCY9539949.1 YhgE/Pip domain-containing protein [Paenibacillus alvei]MCY9707154.1 YhgE/Pip domain-containing protein [Paenibacillus alvei]MCY9733375.1 YhgE/Pip domain-containing protein [Paenibacillus alvei]MCY9753171.1 YhgE/Pip domain-containing protein [Paenibacillus alvei]
MKNILRIYKTDLRNIITNPAAIIVILAVVILPSLYAWFNILPSWDPYANTKDVAVAVANLDKGAKVEGKDLDVGKKVMDQLKENNKLGWKFVTKEEAVKGVNHGDYYAAIVIPEDFSEKISSVISDHPEKAQLDYYINEKINAISPKVAGAGASTLVSNISSNFVETANKAIFDIFNDVGLKLETNEPDIKKLRDNIFKLEEKLPEIEKLMKSGQVDIIKAKDFVSKAESAIRVIKRFENRPDSVIADAENLIDEGNDTFHKEVPVVKDNLRKLQGVVNDTSKVAENIMNSDFDLGKVETELAKKSAEVESGMNSLQRVITTVEDIDRNLRNNGMFDNVLTSLTDAKRGAEDLKNRLDEAQRTVESVKSIADDKLKDIRNKAIDVNNILDKARASLNSQVAPTVTKAFDEAERLGKMYREHLGQLQEKIDRVNKLIQGSATDASLSDKLNTAIGDLTNQLKLTLSSLEKYKNQLDKLAQVTGVDTGLLIAQLKGMETKLTLLQDRLGNGKQIGAEAIARASEVVGQLINDYDNSIKPRFHTIRGDMQALNRDVLNMIDKMQVSTRNVINLADKVMNRNTADKVIDQINNAKKHIDSGQKVADQLISATEKMKQTVDDGAITDIVDNMYKLKGKIADLSDMLMRASEAAGKANQPTKDALQKIYDSTKDTSASIDKIVKKIDSDVVPAFDKGVKDSRKGLDFIKNVKKEVYSMIPEIEAQLADVKGKINTGEDGLNEFSDKYPELKKKVKDIAAKIREFEAKGDLDQIIDLLRKDAAKESQFFAEPVLLNQHELFPVPNYGSAMSPFFTTLALWVGGLLLISMLIVDIENKQDYKSYQVYFGRWMTFVTIGICQSMIVTLGDMFLLKTYVVHKFWFFAFGIFISIIFVSIVYTLVSVFGNVGKALSIVLLVFQLAASGGTFPIQMTPKFFQKLNPFLPFTHAIGIMREAVGGILWDVVTKHVLILLIYIGIAFVLGVGLKKTINKSSDKFLKKAKQSKLL